MVSVLRADASCSFFFFNLLLLMQGPASNIEFQKCIMTKLINVDFLLKKRVAASLLIKWIGYTLSLSPIELCSRANVQPQCPAQMTIMVSAWHLVGSARPGSVGLWSDILQASLTLCPTTAKLEKHWMCNLEDLWSWWNLPWNSFTGLWTYQCL